MAEIKAKFYKIPCFYDSIKNDLTGRNKFCNILLVIAVKIHVFVSISCEFLTGNGIDFPIYIENIEDN
jgi:hypothetical protein